MGVKIERKERSNRYPKLMQHRNGMVLLIAGENETSPTRLVGSIVDPGDTNYGPGGLSSDWIADDLTDFGGVITLSNK